MGARTASALEEVAASIRLIQGGRKAGRQGGVELPLRGMQETMVASAARTLLILGRWTQGILASGSASRCRYHKDRWPRDHISSNEYNLLENML